MMFLKGKVNKGVMEVIGQNENGSVVGFRKKMHVSIESVQVFNTWEEPKQQDLIGDDLIFVNMVSKAKEKQKAEARRNRLFRIK